MSPLQEWLPPRECIENSGQFDAFLVFVSSQWFVKSTAYPDAVLLALAKDAPVEEA